MCGIFCSTFLESTGGSKQSLEIDAHLSRILESRGPDASKVLCYDNVLLGGYVLWQQGPRIISQPVECGDIVLLLNGDIFNTTDEVQSDTEWLASAIAACDNDLELCNLFRTLEGPYSLIFYNRKSSSIYFGRDSLGRHSLLIERNNLELRILSASYFCEASERLTMELHPLGLFKFHIAQSKQWTLYPWTVQLSDVQSDQIVELQNKFGITVSLGNAINPLWLRLDIVEKESFDFYSISDVGNANTAMYTILEEMLKHKAVVSAQEEFAVLLENSVRQRVQKTPPYCKLCVGSQTKCCHSKVAIFFSGGIDCSILAVLAHKYVDENDSIDLINVAFESSNAKSNTWDVPDRCSAKESLAELSKICGTRKWNLIEVNISREKMHTCMEEHIKHLIYPLETVLDESIGCAFWFSARGQGLHKCIPCDSTARVVIVGSGADELFGGYRRHKNAYMRCHGDIKQKQKDVMTELEKDWQRISWRNLGRDDRVIAGNGKTSRAPFIEEHLIRYVRNLKPSQRCCFLYPDGIGDKLFLRLFGFRLGLRSSVSLKKRAIQFGCRIANKNQAATEKSCYLKF